MKAIVALLCFFSTWSLSAQNLPTGFARVAVGGTITTPTALAFVPDGRIFVAQQSGALRVIKNNTLLTTPFVSITVNSSGERGLLGVAIDPDFITNRYVYVYHTVPSSGAGIAAFNRISRFTASGDVALGGSQLVILNLDPLSSATNHNGGALAFGPDGKLYVAIGDNASGSNAQSLATYHGKILRINKDGSAPTDNPFYSESASEQAKRIWAYGLRNPFTFSFQPGTGRLFVNDVGQVTVEEINDATSGGKNFGWPTAEGPSTNPNFTNPVHYYNHTGNAPVGCAITGGGFFNPKFTNYPQEYVGQYFYQDLCSNWIYSLNLSGTPTATLFASDIGGSSLGLLTGPDGNLYYLSRTESSLYKITSTNSSEPVIAQQPVSISVTEGDDAQLTVVATGTGLLAYQWFKDDVAINGANAADIIISKAQLADVGNYKVRITNIAGEIFSDEAALMVVVNTKPIATIDLPLDNATYAAGTTLNFSGHGTDAEDGTLPVASLSWTINFHHDEHVHDQPPIEGITSGTFTIPDFGETSAHVWYRVTLVVTDSKGAVGLASVDVKPRTTQLTIDSQPQGLQITIDGQPTVSPTTIESVEGMKREISAMPSQPSGSDELVFSHWGHGGDITQWITTPAAATVYTAYFDLILDVQGDSQIWLYPVPASDQITIKVNEPSVIQFYDMLGRKWELIRESSQGLVTLDVRNIPDGVYVISLTNNGETLYKKVLIKR